MLSYTARVPLFAVLCQPSERMDDDTTHLQAAAHVAVHVLPIIIGAVLLRVGHCLLLVTLPLASAGCCCWLGVQYCEGCLLCSI